MKWNQLIHSCDAAAVQNSAFVVYDSTPTTEGSHWSCSCCRLLRRRRKLRKTEARTPPCSMSRVVTTSSALPVLRGVVGLLIFTASEVERFVVVVFMGLLTQCHHVFVTRILNLVRILLSNKRSLPRLQLQAVSLPCSSSIVVDYWP